MRYERNLKLKRHILKALDRDMREYNPWYRVYRTAYDWINISNPSASAFIIVISKLSIITISGADIHRENLPSVSEVTTLIKGEINQPRKYDVILTIRYLGGRCRAIPILNINSNHPLYYILYYVFFFPRGDPGRKVNVKILKIANPKRKKTKLTA